MLWMKKCYVILYKEGVFTSLIIEPSSVVVHTEDFLDLSLYLSCMFELPKHDVEILIKMLGSECLLSSKLH